MPASVDRPRDPRGMRNPKRDITKEGDTYVSVQDNSSRIINLITGTSHYHDTRYLRLDGENEMEGDLSFTGGDRSIVAPPGRDLDIRLGDDAGSNYITFSNASGSPLAYMSSLGGWLVTALTCTGDLDVAQLNAQQVVYSPDDSGHLSGSDEFRFNPDSHLVTVPGLTVSDLTAGRVPYVGTGGRLIDASGLTYASDTLTAPNLAASGLTATRIPIITTGGKLTDDAGLTYASGTLSLAGNLSFTGADRTISSASGYNLNVKLGDAAGGNKLSIQNSGSTEKAYVDSYGYAQFSKLGVGVAPASGYNVYVMRNNVVSSGTHMGALIWEREWVNGASNAWVHGLSATLDIIQNTSPASISQGRGLAFEVNLNTPCTAEYLYGIIGNVYGKTSGNVTYAYGSSVAVVQSTSSSGTISNAFCYNAMSGLMGGSGSITNAYLYYARMLTGGSGTVTNLYGLYIDSSITAASTSYAIYNASTAPIYTAGDLQLASGKVLKVGGVQVVGSQQSAIADVTVTGTAEDGTARSKINAILAALRAHGLIAT